MTHQTPRLGASWTRFHRRRENGGTRDALFTMIYQWPLAPSPASLFDKSTTPRVPVLNPRRDPRTKPTAIGNVEAPVPSRDETKPMVICNGKTADPSRYRTKPMASCDGEAPIPSRDETKPMARCDDGAALPTFPRTKPMASGNGEAADPPFPRTKPTATCSESVNSFSRAE